MLKTRLQEKLLELALEIKQNSANKGFWDMGETRSRGEMIMLMISELGECLEAHRKDKTFNNEHGAIKFLDGSATSDNPGLSWEAVFRKQVKDTWQDEMADVVIRLLDYTDGWGISVVLREYNHPSTGNFAHDLLIINNALLRAFEEHEMDDVIQKAANQTGLAFGRALAMISTFCEWYPMDLLQHVQWKMKYNATREKLHGKKY